MNEFTVQGGRKRERDGGRERGREEGREGEREGGREREIEREGEREGGREGEPGRTYVGELADGVGLDGDVILLELLFDLVDAGGDVFGLRGDERERTTRQTRCTCST